MCLYFQLFENDKNLHEQFSQILVALFTVVRRRESMARGIIK